MKTIDFAVCQGMDTREERAAIQEGFYSWLFNIQPVGRRTLRFLNGKGPTLYTAPSGDTVIYYAPCVIGSTFYIIVFLASGKADQVQISNGAVVHISAAANTFYSGSGSYPHFATWGTSGIIIVSPLGYWAWDGTTLYNPGAISPVWLNGNETPITVTGTCTTGSANVTAITNGTTGLAKGDNDASGTFVAGTTIATVVSQTELTMSATYAGTTGTEVLIFSPLQPAGTVTSGSQSIGYMTTTADLAIGMVDASGTFPSGAIITDITSSENVTMSEGATLSGTVNLDYTWPMPTGVSGTAIEIYNASPWLVNGRQILAGAPGNGANFAVSSGAVNDTVQDAYVQKGYVGLKQLDGFLYLLAASAVDVISDVNTSGTPPTTTFLRVNVSTRVGTPWRDTIVQLPSSICAANPAGAIEVAGGQVRKVSDLADGIFENGMFGTNPSACMVTLSEVPCYAVTVTVSDPDGVSADNAAMALWDGRRWFTGSQETAPAILSTQDNESAQTAWCSDGSTIFQGFAAPSSALTKKAKSWYSFKEGLTLQQQLQRAYALGQSAPSSIAIDTDTQQAIMTLTLTQEPGTAPLVSAGQAEGPQFLGVGFTLTSTAAAYDFLGLTLGYKDAHRFQ